MFGWKTECYVLLLFYRGACFDECGIEEILPHGGGDVLLLLGGEVLVACEEVVPLEEKGDCCCDVLLFVDEEGISLCPLLGGWRGVLTF